MKTTAIDDLVTLTGIPSVSFRQLSDKVQWIICHAIEETKLEGDEYTEIDLDFGILAIKVEDGAIKYRFMPSKKFEKAIKSTVITNKSPLTLKVESVLKDRICNTYKDLF